MTVSAMYIHILLMAESDSLKASLSKPFRRQQEVQHMTPGCMIPALMVHARHYTGNPPRQLCMHR